MYLKRGKMSKTCLTLTGGKSMLYNIFTIHFTEGDSFMRTLCRITCRSLALITAFSLFIISGYAAEPEQKTTPPAAAKGDALSQGPVARVNGSDRSEEHT